jgi:hypothetical protein
MVGAREHTHMGRTKNLSKPPRTQNRFREREAARAGRAAKAIGADRVEIDPATGKISIIIGGKSGEGQPNDNEVESWLSKQKS